MESQLTPAAFGRAVRDARTALGLSQEGLGEAAGLDRAYVSGLERGVRNPTLTTQVKLAEALGTSLSELVRQSERAVQHNDRPYRPEERS